MVGIKNNNINLIPLSEAISKKKRIDLELYNISNLISKH